MRSSTTRIDEALAGLARQDNRHALPGQQRLGPRTTDAASRARYTTRSSSRQWRLSSPSFTPEESLAARDTRSRAVFTASARLSSTLSPSGWEIDNCYEGEEVYRALRARQGRETVRSCRLFRGKARSLCALQAGSYDLRGDRVRLPDGSQPSGESRRSSTPA